MSIRRIGVLLGKELSTGWRNIMFIFAVAVPVVLTLVVTLVFGTLFAGRARLGLVDQGASQMAVRAAELASLDVGVYAAPAALRAAVVDGALDMGFVLPAGLDDLLRRGEPVALTAYVWGESTFKNRAVAATAFVTLIRDIAGQEAPVEIVTTLLGEGVNVPWESRLLPFIVLMAMILGGSMVPAALLVEEKQKRTLRALTTSPASLGEVFTAKGMLGVMVSVAMAAFTLVLNRAWGPEPALLLLALALGSVMAAGIGLLLGAFIKDINTLFSVVKAGGILLYAPVLVYLFPDIPAWIGQLFPTYYLIHPVVEITQQGASLAEVAPELAVLAILDVLLLTAVALVVRRAPASEGALNPA